MKLTPDFIPSRLFIYYNERVIEHTVQTDSGAMIRDGIKSVAKKGVCPEDDWPYDISKFTHKPSAKAYQGSELGLTGGLRLRLGLTQWVR